MKWLRILICNLFVIILITNVSGKYLSAKIGIVDFTSEASRDFYHTTPVLVLSSNVVQMARLDVVLSLGYSHTKVNYNDTKHNVNAFPGFVSMMYNLPNVGSRVAPYFGSGIGFLAKYDKNEWLSKAHKSYTYGYHILAGCYVPMNKRLAIDISMQFTSFTPPNNESIDVSGVVHTIGIRYNFGKFLKTNGN